MTTSSRAAASPRLADILTPESNSFGVLRFLMATFVLISHSYLYSAGTSDAEPLVAWIGRSLGECAVQVFFILSGVMVAQSFDRSRSILDFAVARILRIFPALIVCVLITSFIIAPMVSRLSVADYLASPGLYAYLAKTLSLSTGSASLPGVFETVPYSGYVNSSLWTLKYEVICYVGLGVLGLAGLFQPRWRIAALAGLALMVATVSLSLPSDPDAFVFLDNLRYFAVFFGSGVLAYLARKHLIINGAVLIPVFAFFVLTVRTPLAEVGAALFLGYGALWAATLTWGPLRALCNRFDTSFGIYIGAGPIQQTLLWLIPALTPLWLALLAFAIVFPIAFLSWVVVEKPALRLRPTIVGRLKKQPHAVAVPG
jgi:peptidoglycan/LPS O-acetylase OafA/YrhL